MKVRISEVMTKDVESVSPEDPLGIVISRMMERRISCVVVCDGSEPVGVISERDVVRVLSDHLHGGSVPARAAEVMSTPPVTVSSRWSLDRARELLQERAIRRLVVVDGEGGLAGLITQSDLLGAQREVLEKRVRARTAELLEANERLRQLSMRDSLMNIGNRRAMDEALDRTHSVAERYGRVYSLVLVDVDHFKGFNDFYGHPEADQVLRRIAHVLVDAARNCDSVFRYGGEEALVLMPETDLEGALVVAERYRAAIEGLAIPNEASPHGCVTVSCGVAASHDYGQPAPVNWRDPLSRADASLYDAKRNGRNRVGAAARIEAA